MHVLTDVQRVDAYQSFREISPRSMIYYLPIYHFESSPKQSAEALTHR